MPQKAVDLLVVPGFADWEPAHATAELRRHGGYRIEVVGLTGAGGAGDHGLLAPLRSKKLDYDTAQDIASDVVAHLWERAKHDSRLITSPAARDKFVIGSAKHARLVHLRNELRRQERQAVFEIESRERNYLWMNPEEEVAYLQLADAVKELLDGMPAGRRDAFLLVHESACDYQTVAAMLDISVEAAESRVCMVRKVLRTFLAKYREEGEVKAVKKENKERKGRLNAA